MIAWANLTKDVSQKFAMLAGISMEKPHQLSILDPNPGKSSVLKYTYHGAFTEEAIFAWIDSYLKGEVNPTQKTEQTPSNQSPEWVMPLNQESFEKVTGDRELDVLVMFYTSKVCKVCDELWPLYIQAA